MLQAHITHSNDIVWKPSPVVAVATSVDDSQVAAARDDGSLEVWLVSPGAVGWHCLLTIQGDPISRVSSLVWCRVSSDDPPYGRLFSSSIDGTISEWDLFHLKQKIVLDTIGVSIWQMALAPLVNPINAEQKQQNIANGHSNGIDAHTGETSDSESGSDSDDELYNPSSPENPRLGLGCDDGCVRIYTILPSNEVVYTKSFPRVSGRILSVTWSPDSKMIYSGSSDGYIRCWDANTAHEIYRITVGLGGLGAKHDVCVWSLIALRSGTLVSGDSTGSVQFWDAQHGTQLQAHTYHKGDVNSLAAAPSHNRVFSAGSDGKVILYKLSACKNGVGDETASSATLKKWTYIGHVQAHTHDVRALTVAVPINQEDAFPDRNAKRLRRKKKSIDFSYHKWAHLGIPMLISAGDDTKLFAYSINEFTKFSPHDICPAPQRVPIQLILNSVFNQMSLLLVQASDAISILSVSLKNGMTPDISTGHFESNAITVLAAKVSCKAGRKIVCSAISPSGSLFTYSDHVKPNLYELKWDTKSSKQNGKAKWVLEKKKLLREIPFAHSMVFSFDSSRLMIAGHDRRIYVVDAKNSELVHTFTPCREESDKDLPPSEPPITKMFTSSDGQWLAAINCFGDIYIFNLEIQRQHWFISRLNGASVTAGGFSPQNSNVLIITTSANQVYAFDIEAKKLGEWSMRHTHVLPRRFQEFPGEVIGLSFPSTSDSIVVIYSARAMCAIDFGLPVDRDDDFELINSVDSVLRKKLLSMNGTTLKRKLKEASLETKLISKKNFEFYAFRNPVLFIGHLSEKCVLIIDKPWSSVLKTFEAQPVHRHIYGT